MFRCVCALTQTACPLLSAYWCCLGVSCEKALWIRKHWTPPWLDILRSLGPKARLPTCPSSVLFSSSFSHSSQEGWSISDVHLSQNSALYLTKLFTLQLFSFLQRSARLSRSHFRLLSTRAAIEDSRSWSLSKLRELTAFHSDASNLPSHVLSNT